MGVAGGMGELAHQTPHTGIAFTHPAGFACAGRFLFARADAPLGRQAVDTAESRRASADFHKQRGRAAQMAPGHGLQ
ncbi:hypothetical protein D3878_18135 [Noviherbaspirillum sedimenti]|uniref:Uncharacterized protein n=1 Tax=Noviherbaspirillum sedimenti TaxID=2320865 RepID=A0A3A3GQL0_9BURK|nr:hypothetical protein D3878_18135 [Noviherbaspirillum sedimenti]